MCMQFNNEMKFSRDLLKDFGVGKILVFYLKREKRRLWFYLVIALFVYKITYVYCFENISTYV